MVEIRSLSPRAPNPVLLLLLLLLLLEYGGTD